MKWEWNNRQQAPPKLIFSKDDNLECIKTVELYYEQAYSAYEYSGVDQQKLDDSYSLILSRQEKYGIELVNNQDFALWAGSPDTGLNDPNGPLPAFDDQMASYFGRWYNEDSFVEPLRSVAMMDKAIYALFWWRFDWNLEEALMFRRRRQLIVFYQPEEEYEMCSEPTKEMAFTLIDYAAGRNVDSRSQNYYPLLDRIVEWMDLQYSEESSIFDL